MPQRTFINLHSRDYFLIDNQFPFWELACKFFTRKSTREPLKFYNPDNSSDCGFCGTLLGSALTDGGQWFPGPGLVQGKMSEFLCLGPLHLVFKIHRSLLAEN
jgi:hypothetical protein